MSDKSEQKVRSKRNPVDLRYEHSHGDRDGILNIYDSSHPYVLLSFGAPGPDLLQMCTENFSVATEHLMKKGAGTHHIFQYGCGIGNYGFRVAVANYLSEGYGVPVDCRDLVETSGASHGLHLILSTLLNMNCVIFVDEATYMIALMAIAQFDGMKIVPVPLNDDGPDVAAFKLLIEKYKCESKSKMFWGMYYTIPTYHNPTGILFSEEICEQLVALSREHDFLIVCDDVYNLLSYRTDKPPKRLFAYDDDADSLGTVISNGSFSKIMAPGIRVGWMECPPRCVEAFHKCGVLNSGGATSNYSAGLVQSLIELGLAQEQLKVYRSAYKERMELVCKVLRQNLPSTCSFIEPDGGYFVWIRLPENCVATDFNEMAREKYKVVTIPSDIFSATKQIRNCIRISIGFQTYERLANATPILCEALREFCVK